MSLETFSKIIIVVIGIGLWKAIQLNQNPPLPKLNENPWWGPGDPQKDDESIKPFKIDISQEQIDDLKNRLSLPVRRNPVLLDANFTYGINSESLDQIVEFWKSKYDWRKAEEKLNKFEQFTTQIEGLSVHFLRVKPPTSVQTPKKKRIVLPLLLIHGWPGSIFEFDQILPLLTNTNSEIAFEVVCPSLPGYGFTEAPARKGLGSLQTAQLFLKLMNRLGHETFYVQGGDWGSLVGATMATLYPNNVMGIHLNMISVSTMGTNAKYFLGSVLPSGFMMKKEDEERLYPMKKAFQFMLRESGYFHLQTTKPDTIGAALSDSPRGLAAYIFEKFSTWTNKNNPQKPDGGLLEKDFPISIERILDNISLYWFTNSITSSMRYYAESFQDMINKPIDDISTDVACGLSYFAHEVFNQPDCFVAHKYTQIVASKKHSTGGHFAAMECPHLLAEDVIEFVTEVEYRKQRLAHENQ